MEDLTVAYATFGVGVVLLVLVVLAAVPHVRRFTRANAALKADIAVRGASLRALMNSRRPRSE
jgi:hypothetical protein